MSELLGSVRSAGNTGPESSGRFRPPISAYPDKTGCAITGGTFYAPAVVTYPAGYEGDYFFADFCSGWIRRYDPAADRASSLASGLPFPVDLQAGPDEDLYHLERGTGSVGKIGYTP